MELLVVWTVTGCCQMLPKRLLSMLMAVSGPASRSQHCVRAASVRLRQADPWLASHLWPLSLSQMRNVQSPVAPWTLTGPAYPALTAKREVLLEQLLLPHMAISRQPIAGETSGSRETIELARKPSRLCCCHRTLFPFKAHLQAGAQLV